MTLPDPASELPTSLAALQQQQQPQPQPSPKRFKLPPNPSSTNLAYERDFYVASRSQGGNASRAAVPSEPGQEGSTAQSAPGGENRSEKPAHAKASL